MNKRDEIEKRLCEYILAEVLPGESPAALKDNMPLRTSGVLDSMATLNLVVYVEKTFGIEVEAHEAGVENFDRICDMVLFIERKKAAAKE